jgi:fluoroquinolone transport system ATP-binding protein
MITVDQMTFTYAGASAPAVSELSFSIARGEIFGFLGPSGAGKSTTQKILIGLLKGYAGRVAVLGKDLAAWGSDYYERIGVSFELPNHFLKLTALENLAYFAALYRGPTRDPQELLELVGLGQDGKLPVGQFSKGMKNRLNVARALLHDPELLFLDEPTSGLDPVNAHRIKELIRAQQQAGKTIFLTTHNMAVAEGLCDRVAFMVAGQVKLIDAPRALRLRYGVPTVRVEHQANSHTMREEFALAGLGDNTAFLDLLRSGAVQTIHTQETTLEDIFIRVTGKRLEIGE